MRLTSITFCHLSSGIVLRPRAPGDAGVVDEDVDPAEGRHRLVDDGLHVRRVGDVGDEAFDAKPRAAKRSSVGVSHSSRRAQIISAAPASARPSAISSPRPRDPPVTIATRPVSVNNS